MTDEEHVAAVREAVRQLNKALDAAARDGLAVRIETISKSTINDPEASTLVTAEISRTTVREMV